MVMQRGIAQEHCATKAGNDLQHWQKIFLPDREGRKDRENRELGSAVRAGEKLAVRVQ
jgi:hypothetical protein